MKRILKQTLKFIFILIFSISCVILLSSCAECSEGNNQTTEWISKAQKPIICKRFGEGIRGEVYWTLIAADGKVYASGGTTMNLPDTIKVIMQEKSK